VEIRFTHGRELRVPVRLGSSVVETGPLPMS
jgi:hypothetical protein